MISIAAYASTGAFPLRPSGPPPPYDGGGMFEAQQRGRAAAILGGLIDDTEQGPCPGERLAKTLLLAFEGIETAAQHERRLILQDVAGGAQLALIAQPLAQQARLAVGATVAELGEVQ